MFVWLAENWSTILVSVILLVIVGAIIVKMVKDKKAGKHSCGGDCGNCSGCRGCH